MPEEAQEKQSEKANSIVRKYLWAGAAGGIIPIPLVDLALISGLQFKMVHSLSKHYGVPFSKELVRTSIVALIGGGSSAAISTVLMSTSGILGIAGTVVAGGATTYAIGKVFIMHFESGGTLLTFNPEKVRAEYERQLKEGGKLLTQPLKVVDPLKP